MSYLSLDFNDLVYKKGTVKNSQENAHKVFMKPLTREQEILAAAVIFK